jgi:FMN phosphatase YigB (HAD superfamily)
MKGGRVLRFAIGFDFDHTLGFDNTLEVDAFVRLVRELAPSAQRDVDEERARIAMVREIGHYRSGRCSIDHAVALALDDVLGDGAGVQPAIETFRSLAVEMAPGHVRPVRGAIELLRVLDARSVPYAILTNGWNPLQQVKADCIGFAKPVFVSDDLGLRKPNVHAFNVLRDHFTLPADSIWYVGDDPRVDVLGALGAGMRAVWFNGERGKFPTDTPAPTAVVTDLPEIAALIPSEAHAKD